MIKKYLKKLTKKLLGIITFPAKDSPHYYVILQIKKKYIYKREKWCKNNVKFIYYTGLFFINIIAQCFEYSVNAVKWHDT
jgi:hypothetical protein